MLLVTKGTVFTAKKGKTVRPQSRRLQEKGEMCTLQTGKLCYNAININYALVLICRIARELSLSSVMVLRKGVTLSCTCWHRISPQSYESYIYSGVELELAWSKVSTKACGFTFGSISLHSSKRIKEILTQKHQYTAKYLSRFNDKNAFRK